MWIEVIIQDLGGEQPNFCDDFPKHFAQTDRISTSSFWMELDRQHPQHPLLFVAAHFLGPSGTHGMVLPARLLPSRCNRSWWLESRCVDGGAVLFPALRQIRNILGIYWVHLGFISTWVTFKKPGLWSAGCCGDARADRAALRLLSRWRWNKRRLHWRSQVMWGEQHRAKVSKLSKVSKVSGADWIREFFEVLDAKCCDNLDSWLPRECDGNALGHLTVDFAFDKQNESPFWRIWLLPRSVDVGVLLPMVDRWPWWSWKLPTN